MNWSAVRAFITLATLVLGAALIFSSCLVLAKSPSASINIHLDPSSDGYLRLIYAFMLGGASIMGVDIFLELAATQELYVVFKEKYFICLLFILHPLIYFYFEKCRDPAVIICLQLIAFHTLFCLLSSLISNALQNLSSTCYIYSSTILFSIFCVLTSIRVQYSRNIYVVLFLFISFSLSMVLISVGVYNFVASSFSRIRSYQELKLTTTDYTTILYITLLLLSGVAPIFLNLIIQVTDSAYSEIVMFYITAAIEVCICFALTILPGRLVRQNLSENEVVMAAKHSFIRFITHEIRSPLNIAIPGLDILGSYLQSAEVDSQILDLIEDISDSTNAAVDILNDMLQYETIEGILVLESILLRLSKTRFQLIYE
jgi:hypothetical protein